MRQIAAALAALMLMLHPLLMASPAQGEATRTVIICGAHGVEQITITNPDQAPAQVPNNCDWCCLCCAVALPAVEGAGCLQAVLTVETAAFAPQVQVARTRAPMTQPGSPRGPPALS